MSEHAWVQENLNAYATGGLSAQESERVDRHAKSCNECASLKAEIGEMEQLMEGICARVRPDAGLEDRAIQRLRQARRPRPNWQRFAAAAAAVFLLGMVGGAVQMLAVNGTLPLPGMERQIADAGEEGAPRSHFGFVRSYVSGPRVENDGIAESELIEIAKKERNEYLKSRKGIPLEALIPGETSKATDETEKADKTTLPLRKATPPAEIPPLRGFGPGQGGAFGGDGINGKFDEAGARFYPAKPGEDKKVKGELARDGIFYDKEANEPAQDKVKEGLKVFDYRVRDDLDKSPEKIEKLKPGKETPATGLLPDPIPILPPPPASTVPATSSYLPMSPPPVVVTEGKPGDAKPGSDPAKQGNGGEVKQPKAEPPAQPKVEPPKEPAPEKTGRMIIRTGEMDFETDSFDNSVDSITKLITGVKGGFIATVNSDKLPNGKTRGSVIVRMPPQHLDKFIYDLRRELAKTSELKNQRLGSLDVTKQYTDIESRLRAARAIEERLIAIIKTGKGEIKDLVAAEKELGVWRTKIEEMEGEIRYYANQVSLSTLTISIAEKEIQAPTAILITETVSLRIEVEDVGKAHQIAMKAVEDLKGRITHSELKQHTAGQFLSILHAEIPPGKRDLFLEQLKKLGIVSDHQENQRQHTEGGTGKAPDLKPKQSDVVFQVTMNNTANIRPRVSADLKIATTDVPGAYAKLLERIAKVKGQVRDGKLNEQDKLNIHAHLDFNVPTSEKPAIDKLLDEVGPVLERVNIQAPVNELSTASKFGYTLLLRDFASIPPRQALAQTIATIDVQGAYAKLQDAIAKAKGQIADAKLNEQDKLNITAQLDFTVPSEEKAGIEKLLADIGTVLSRNNVQTPAHQLATPKKFGFALFLRDFASIPPSKATDLKVATSDVPGSYAKLLEVIAKVKGQLVDARLNEQDKFNISAQIDFSVPTDDKAAIDKLLADIGTVLSRNNVQAPMNQLSIAKKFGYSITLRDFANILPGHAADIKLATTDVPNNYAKLVDAVVKAKGQISAAKLNEQDKLNVSAFLNFTVPIAEKAAIDKMLGDMGTMLSRNNVQAPASELTTDRKFGFGVALRDFANIPPRETFNLQLAAMDVAVSFRELQDAVAAAKGLVSVGQLIEDNKVKMEARLDFDVPAAERQAIEKLFGKVGAVVGRTSSQIAVNDLATDQKVGYKLTIRSTASIPPRETVQVKLEVKDVDGKAADLKELIVAGKGRVIDSNIDRHENGQVLGVLKFEVPLASEDSLLKQIKGAGTVVSQQAKRNPQVAENELTTAHIVVILTGVTPIVPNDEGLGSYIRASLYMSFKVFSVCLMLIILGVSAVLPWALVIWIAYKAYSRFAGSRNVQLATANDAPPPSAAAPPE